MYIACHLKHLTTQLQSSTLLPKNLAGLVADAQWRHESKEKKAESKKEGVTSRSIHLHVEKKTKNTLPQYENA